MRSLRRSRTTDGGRIFSSRRRRSRKRPPAACTRLLLPSPSAGTHFQLLDYSAISAEDDHRLCESWTRTMGIASIPISVFYQPPPEGQHYLRFCFAKSDQLLLQAAEVLCRI